MKFAVKKLLDPGNNVTGYKTEGLDPELYINMFIEEEAAEAIFERVSELKEIPDMITGVANVGIKTRKSDDDIELLLPDVNGDYKD